MTERTPKMDRDQVRQELMREFDVVFGEVADAIDDAPLGRIIADSEEKVRDAMDRFRRSVYEAALQAKVDAAEASFSPSEERNDGETHAS